MKATFISQDKNIKKFSMEFTGEEFEHAVIDAYKANKHKFIIDGFRKGKAPRSLIETRYGEDVFFEDAINQMFSQNYSDALSELELDAIDRPDLELSEIKKGEGLTITVTVGVYPEFEVKDYKNVEIEKIDTKVSEEDINKEIEALQRRNARMVLVERPAKDGDTLLIDYEGYVGKNKFDGGSAERYALKLGSNTFIPGFEAQLVGAAAGEERQIKVTFPEEYHAEDLAGQEALFKCKVHEIKEEELPELNDDFAKDVSEYDTYEELRKETETRLESSYAEKSKNQMKNAVIEKIYNSNEIDVPGVLIEDEIDNMIKEFDQQLRYQGMSIDKYFEYAAKDPIEFRSEMREEAFRKVKTRMIVSKIAQQEKIEVPEDEIEKEIAVIADYYKMEADKAKEMMGSRVQVIEQDLRIKKAVDLIFDNAIIK